MKRIDLGQIPYEHAVENMRKWVDQRREGRRRRPPVPAHASAGDHLRATQRSAGPAGRNGRPAHRRGGPGWAGHLSRSRPAGRLPGDEHSRARAGGHRALAGQGLDRGVGRARLRHSGQGHSARHDQPGRGVDPGPPQACLDRNAHQGRCDQGRCDQSRLRAQRRPGHERVPPFPWGCPPRCWILVTSWISANLTRAPSTLMVVDTISCGRCRDRGIRYTMTTMVLPVDGHVHSEWSWDATGGSMERTCARAVELGLPGVAFTEHVDHVTWTAFGADVRDFPHMAALLTPDGTITPPPLDVEGYLGCDGTLPGVVPRAAHPHGRRARRAALVRRGHPSAAPRRPVRAGDRLAALGADRRRSGRAARTVP